MLIAQTLYATQKKTTMKVKFLVLLFLSTFFYSNSQNTLIGTKAPELNPDKWIYPDGVIKSNETKDFTVVDFWFTKCAPCVATIPELNYLSLQNPNIRFLSITFDNTKIIESFIKKAPMYYPIGIDTKSKLVKKFKVNGFPETFIIDKKGIIIWQGHPIHLSSALDKLSNGKQNKSNFELSQKNEWNQRSSYSMNIKEHTLGMGPASSLSIQPFDIMLLNRKVKSILNDFYGINISRIITSDSLFLEKSYDVQLKLNKEVIDPKNSLDIFKFHYLNSIGLKYEKITKSSLVHELIISDNKKLNTFISKEKYEGTSIRYDNWESKGIKLEKLKSFLENNYNLVIELNNENTNKFNFILPKNNLKKALLKLENQYGITFLEKNKRTYFYEFKKN
jgi:thiol-disulfide isomerase/thioredoxin